MKKSYLYILVIVFLTTASFALLSDELWGEKDLLLPSELSETLNNTGAEQPVIYSIGPSGLIKNAIDIGSTDDKENIKKLKKALQNVPKNKTVVIYCGCCPFEKCPNIRPAFSVLKDMKFTNPKLLDLPKNLKADWIDKGYPMNN